MSLAWTLLLAAVLVGVNVAIVRASVRTSSRRVQRTLDAAIRGVSADPAR